MRAHSGELPRLLAVVAFAAAGYQLAAGHWAFMVMDLLAAVSLAAVAWTGSHHRRE